MKNSTSRSWSNLLASLVCFNMGRDVERVNDTSGQEVVVDVSSSSNNGSVSPSHLLIMINGIVGSSENWRYAAKQFSRAYPEDLLVHRSKCNQTLFTFDGVDVMGERLADEVASVVEQNPSLQKISFVCHSLGGLISRYAIARLYETNYLKRLSRIQDALIIDGSIGESLQEKYKGKIAGLEPLNFITFATPHLGSRGHKQVPLFCGLHNLEIMARRSSGVLGRTGRHLFLADGQNGKPPLLLQMVNDLPEDYPFITALQSFKRRVVYANVRFDQIVGWSTSSLRHTSQLPQGGSLSRHERYKHVVNVELPRAANDQDQDQDPDPDPCTWEDIVSGWKNFKTEETMRVMLRGLTRLSWERVDVKFNGAKQRLLAHNTIQVQTKLLHSSGTDVIRHMIDNFHL